MLDRSCLYLILLCVPAVGCKATAQAKASAQMQTAEAEEVNQAAEQASTQTLAPSALQGEFTEVALLGARHDLRLAPDRKTATCACVAVALGGTDDPGLQWRSVVPQIDVTTQLVLALSSDGVPCPDAARTGSGASYWGYRQASNDVIVIVEEAKPGRPVTSGAIIPKPFEQGQVYLQPLDRNVPYGRPLNGPGHLCPLGNPGAKRPVPNSLAPADASEE